MERLYLSYATKQTITYPSVCDVTRLSHIQWAVLENYTFTGPFPGPPRSAGTRKVKPIWILLKQETVSGSGISWAIYKSAPHSKQITVPAPHHSVFSGWMPFLLSNQQHQSTEGYVLQKDDPNSSTKITSNHSHCQLLLQFSLLQVFRTGCWQHPYVSYLVPC